MIGKVEPLPTFFWLAVLAALLLTACSEKNYVLAKGDTLTFFYRDANAKEIMFASSIDHFQLHPATRTKKDLWEVTVPLNYEFSYFYTVDGKVTLPDCPDTVIDDFGGRNCLYVHSM